MKQDKYVQQADNLQFAISYQAAYISPQHTQAPKHDNILLPDIVKCTSSIPSELYNRQQKGII